jgi:ketosteroid isomerase-like protein
LDVQALVNAALEHLSTGNVDGFLSLCTDDTKFFIGGQTRISGDHDVSAFRAVAPELSAANGVRRDLIGIAVTADASGADAIVKDHVVRDGNEWEYHAILEFQLAGGKITYFWIYVHEFDAFSEAWS